MGSLRGHVWAVQAGTQVFEGLDVRAIARWPKGGATSTVDVVVNHAGPVLRGFVEARRERISILAGYQEDQGAVEIGGGRVVRDTAEEDRASVDRPLSFQLSARKATDEIVLSAAFEDVSTEDVLRYIAAQAGLATEIDLSSSVIYPTYSLSGGLVRAVDAVVRDAAGRWDVDNATLRVWSADAPRRRTADVWSPSTGLERVSGAGNEIRAQAFLRPALRPGDLIRIVDETYQGDVTVAEVVHEIDTFGGRWATTIAGRPA